MEKNDDDDDNNRCTIGVPMKEKLYGCDMNAEAEAAKDGLESSKSREEGELSSDDDEYREDVSTSQIADCDAARAESVQAAPVHEATEDIRTEKFIRGNKSTSTVDVSSGIHSHVDYDKCSEKNRVPFVPFLISFSDDDTASDSDAGRNKNLASKEKTQGADRSRKPPLPTVQKSQKFQHNTLNRARVKAREAHPSRPSIPLMTKLNRANSRNNRQIPNFRNLNNPQKAPVGQNPERKQNIYVNPKKLQLQDLRQLIAIRESELKLKSTQGIKNSAAGLLKNRNIQNPQNLAKRVLGADADDGLQIGAKEFDKKRQKVARFESTELGLESQENIHSIEGSLISGKSEFENYSRQVIDDSGHLSTKDSIQTSHSNHPGLQEQNQGPIFLSSVTPVANKGGNLTSDSRMGDKNDKAPGPFILMKQAGQMNKRTGECLPKMVGNMELTRADCQDIQVPIQNRFTANNIQGSYGDQVKSSEEAPPSNPGFANYLDKRNPMGGSNMDLRSLLGFEELLDKELEEAQEHRHKCEIEERNALKAYRKAQRALMEANAKCSQLFSKRDLYADQLRSLMMDNVNLFFSSRPHNQVGAGLKVTNNISDVNALTKPASSHHLQAALDIYSRGISDSDVPSTSNAFQNLSNLHVAVQNMVSDPHGERNGSSSEAPKQGNVSHGACCTYDDLSHSAHVDGEIFQFEGGPSQGNVESPVSEDSNQKISKQKAPECNGRTEEHRNDGSGKQLSFNSSQDSLLLEASLRSQLFEKLKAKKFLKRGTSQGVEVLGKQRVESDNSGKELETIANTTMLLEVENEKNSDLEVGDEAERSFQPHAQVNNPLDVYHSEHASSSAADPMDHHCSLESQQSTICSTFLCPTVKSAFIHLKVVEPVGVLKSQTVSSDVFDSVIEEYADKNINGQIQAIRSNLDTKEMLSSCVVRETGYYSCNLAIDPSWPLCMYELRGKCNNNECPWQHVKDYSREIGKHDTNDITGCQGEEFHTTAMVSKFFDYLMLSPPTYVVGSDVLKPDSQSHTSMLVQGYGKCWQKSFSTFLVLSSSFPPVLRLNEPFLHGTEARIEVHNGWNRQSSYFQSKNGTENEVDQCFVDAEQSLDIALLNFYQEANTSKGQIEALKVLVRAIEADPRSAVLWIVYLQMYHCNQKSIGKDDLFQYAVCSLLSYSLKIGWRKSWMVECTSHFLLCLKLL